MTRVKYFEAPQGDAAADLIIGALTPGFSDILFTDKGWHYSSTACSSIW